VDVTHVTDISSGRENNKIKVYVFIMNVRLQR
jgi:hypothetical protein